MREKKFTGGPTPAAEHGRPSDPKTIGTAPVHQPQPGHRQEGKHPNQGAKHPHSPPVSANAPRQTVPTPRIPLQHAADQAINANMGTSQVHSTVQGTRYPSSGGQSVRPYTGMGEIRARPTGQEHPMAKTPRVPMQHGTTKKVRGMIGKAKSKHAISRYP